MAPGMARLNPASRGGQVGEQGLQGGQWGKPPTDSCPTRRELGESVEVAREALAIVWAGDAVARSKGWHWRKVERGTSVIC